MVLVVVVVVIALLALGALTFSELMMAEREGAEVAVVQSQARALADSGVEMARLFLGQDAATQQQAGGCYDNASRFRGMAVIPEAGARGIGRFTIAAPSQEDGRIAGIRFGLEDESARLNLNTLVQLDQKTSGSGRQILMGLPGMTEDLADAILDWMDPDDESREFGAEIDSYASLNPGYATRNGPLETLEELLLVRGLAPSLLFGMDANRNYLVDSAEINAGIMIQGDNSDGSLNSGWAAYLTLYSAEANVRPDGTPKINLNQDDLEKLYQELESTVGGDWAMFIVGFRQNGPYQEPAGASKTPGRPAEECHPNFDDKAKVTLASLLDLVGPRVRARVKEEKQPVILESPFPADPPGSMSTFLPKLLDYCTVTSSPSIPGRVNINQASRAVLSGVLSAIPDVTADVVEQIIVGRPQDPTQIEDEYRHETWLLSQGIVTLDVMTKLMPYVCAGGNVYRAQVIGYYDKGGPAARIEVVLDATTRPPRIVFWRDMSHLGRGYPLETLGVEARE